MNDYKKTECLACGGINEHYSVIFLENGMIIRAVEGTGGIQKECQKIIKIESELKKNE